MRIIAILLLYMLAHSWANSQSIDTGSSTVHSPINFNNYSLGSYGGSA